MRRDKICRYGKFIILSERSALKTRKTLAKRVTEVYASVPIPKFYVVVIFEEVGKDSCFVGGESHNKFVRFKIDQIARTIPGPILREWWIRTLDASHRSLRKGQGV